VQASMNTPIVIKRGQLGTLDPLTGIVGGLTNAVIIYEGPARIHAVAGQGDIAVGEGELSTRQVVISIPWDATPVPLQNDLVIVGDDSIRDPDLNGEAYQVREVSGGSLFGDARRLSCVGWHGNRYWSGS
jgi:hypothetical protein